MANRQALAWCRRCSRLGLGGRRHQAWRDSPSSDWQRKGALAPLSEQAGSCNSGRALRRKRATGLKLPGTALRTEMRRPAGRAQNMANRQALAWCRRCSRLGLGGRRHQAWRDSPSSDWQRKGALAPLFEQAGSCNSGRALRRKRATGLKVEGQKSHAEKRPEVVAEAKRLRRKRPKGGQRSYRQIATELFQGGSVSHPLLGAETGPALDQDNRIVTHEELRRASRAAAG